MGFGEDIYDVADDGTYVCVCLHVCVCACVCVRMCVRACYELHLQQHGTYVLVQYVDIYMCMYVNLCIVFSNLPYIMFCGCTRCKLCVRG